MRSGHRGKARRAGLAGAVLLALALRALVPPGFMPSSEQPFSIEICPDGFPAQLLAHHHHHGVSDSLGTHCVFAVCAHGLLTQGWPLSQIALIRLIVSAPPIVTVRVIRLVHLPYPRGPPLAA
ncbi:MAG TPA: hypothetical protein VMG11_00900 [Steroidobacteraceae bacterium]|nr:hypothetical protein [Steroidobacteraceae bacterium]